MLHFVVSAFTARFSLAVLRRKLLYPGMPSPERVDHWFLPALGRAAVTGALSWGMMVVYLFINRGPTAETIMVEMPSWVPFWPAFLPPYLALLGVTLFLPVVICVRRRFRACMLAYVLAWLLVMPWWVITPTMLPRPELPDGMWAPAFAWLWTIDQPFNVTPCAHAVGPIVAGWFAAREYPAWRWPLATFLALTLPSIAFVWQHRPVDILLGAGAAVIAIAISEAFLRRTATPALQSATAPSDASQAQTDCQSRYS